MSVVHEVTVSCDKCGGSFRFESDLREDWLFEVGSRPSALEGWERVSPDHHLCPACAREYLALKAEMAAKLHALAGVAEPA